MAIVEDLIVSEYGAFVGLHSKRIRVSCQKECLVEAPLIHLKTVQILTRSASISAAALAACCEAGIPIHFIDPIEGNYASVISPVLTTVVQTRRAQFSALEGQLAVDIAKAMGAGKLRAQVTNLKYLARHHDESSSSLIDVSIELQGYADQLERLQATTLDEIRSEIMGLEGYSARLYWEQLSQFIPSQYNWTGRSGRHASDPANMLLNYGYAILRAQVQNALAIAGLEPHAGLLHTDRPGKPSLTLDLMEEFRSPVVDRTVIGLLKRDFQVPLDEDGRLDREVRAKFAEHILSRLDAQCRYDGKRISLRSVIQKQARLLASALRGETTYTSYTGG